MEGHVEPHFYVQPQADGHRDRDKLCSRYSERCPPACTSFAAVDWLPRCDDPLLCGCFHRRCGFDGCVDVFDVHSFNGHSVHRHWLRKQHCCGCIDAAHAIDELHTAN